MKAIKFPEHNVVFAKDQPEYLPLPAYTYKSAKGRVVSCWRMGLRERLKILFIGKVYLSLLTFNKPLQPQLLMVDKPMMKKEWNEKTWKAAVRVEKD